MSSHELYQLNTDALRFETHSGCPICQKNKFRRSYVITKFNCKFIWHKCNHCGVTYQNPRLTKESLYLVYQSKNFWLSSSLADSSLRVFGYSDYLTDEDIRIKNDSYKVRRIRKKFLRNGNILDIACGSGTFLRTAQKFGFEVHGVELSEAMAHHGRQQHNLDIANDDFETFPCPENNYDLITLWNADNIFSSPPAAWEKIHHGLKSGGYFIFNFLDNNLLNRFILNLVHVWRDCHSLYIYNKRSVRYLAEKSGFKSCRFFYQFGFSQFDRILHLFNNRNDKEFSGILGEIKYQQLRYLHKIISYAGKHNQRALFLPMIGYFWAVMRKR